MQALFLEAVRKSRNLFPALENTREGEKGGKSRQEVSEEAGNEEASKE